MATAESPMQTEKINKFSENCFFAVRRSDKVWSGLWTDLTIEEVLVRAVQSNVGVTRGGRGDDDSTPATFIHTMPVCSRVSNAKHTVVFGRQLFSEQPVELRVSEKAKLPELYEKFFFFEWLKLQSPFESPPGELTNQLIKWLM